MTPEEYFGTWKPLLDRLLYQAVIPIGVELLAVIALLAYIAFQLSKKG